MKQKFKDGDIVVLKRPVRVYDWPTVSGQNADVVKRIKDVCTIKHVVLGVSSYQATHSIGTVGIVKGYSNIFMLDNETYNDVNKLTSTYDKTLLDVHAVKAKYVWNNQHYYVLNKFKKKHLIVLIDGMLVGFRNGSTLFESVTENFSRALRANVSLNVEATLENVTESEIAKHVKKISRKLKSQGLECKGFSIEKFERRSELKMSEQCSKEAIDTTNLAD